MSSVVVVDDVSPVVLTSDVDRIRYRISGVVGVLKTQHSIFLVCCVGDKDRESKESTSNQIYAIYQKEINKKQINM